MRNPIPVIYVKNEVKLKTRIYYNNKQSKSWKLVEP